MRRTGRLDGVEGRPSSGGDSWSVAGEWMSIPSVGREGAMGEAQQPDICLRPPPVGG